MNRSKVGSLVFVGGTLLFLIAPTSEGSAQGGERVKGDVDADAPNRVAAVALGTTPVAVVAGTRANIGAGAPSTKVMPGNASGNCADDQVEVEGDYCPTVEQKCLRWIDPEGAVPRRCAEFAPTGKCQGKTARKHFCIDRFEYPNKLGEKPVVMKTWYDAADACKAQGKRLCGDSEWTLACEGQERLPYPYGYERSSEACNIDKPHPDVNEQALANPLTRDAEVARLWQGESSGAREGCVSPYGAFDMTGNVDEWVINESGMPYRSGLKGGYWGPVRDRCRPMTTAHYEQFQFYQIGFRCCADAASSDTLKPSQKGISAPAPGKLPSTNPAPSSLTGS